jgi:EmrB/QacA subfamily drug resistance transporter
VSAGSVEAPILGIARRWWIVATFTPSLLLLGLNATILDIPELVMVPELDSDRYRFQWATGGALLGTLIGITLLRWLRGRFGLKRVYIGGLAVAVVGNLICVTAPNVAWLTPGRFIEGIGKGVVVTNVLATLWREFPHNKDLATACYVVGIYFGKAIAPALGGYLCDDPTSWRWVFLLNLIVSVVTIILSWWVLLPDQLAKVEPEPFDWLALGLLVLWLVPLAVCLFRGQKWGWTTSRAWVVLAVLCVTALVGWIMRVSWAVHPLVDLRLFRQRTFALAVAGKAVYMIDFGAVISLLIHYMAVTRQYPRTTTGLVLLPGALTMGMFLALSAVIGMHWSARGRLLVGMFGMSVATWQFGTLDLYTAKETIAWQFALWGAAAGLAVPPLVVLPMVGLTPEQVVTSATIKNLNRELPGTIGSLLVGILLTRGADTHFDLLRQDITYNRAVVENVDERLADHLARRGSDGLRLHEQTGHVLTTYIHANAQAFSYAAVLNYLALACALGFLGALLIRPAR